MAMRSEGTTFARGDGGDPENFAAIAAVKGISGIGGGTPTVLDPTTLADSTRRKMLGLRDEGQLQLTLEWTGSDAEFQGMLADRAAGTSRNFQITFPDTTTYDFAAFVMTFEVSAELDALVQVTISLEIDGAVSVTWPA